MRVYLVQMESVPGEKEKNLEKARQMVLDAKPTCESLILFPEMFATGYIPERAEELAEDTFVLLGTKKPKDKGSSSFKTWLYTIGRNLAIDHIRKQKRRREIPLDEAVYISDPELEQSFINEERKIILHSAMNKLKSDYRQVLWLIYFEGMSNKEAAAVMKKSVHNIETLVSRARKTLKKQLETEGFDYEDL